MSPEDTKRLQDQMHRAPHARSVIVTFCENPECLRPHVALLDERGDVFASFVCPDPLPEGGFFKDLQGALYRSAVERDDTGKRSEPT